MSSSTVLDAILRAAIDATGATAGWVLGRDGDHLRVVAVAGLATGLIGQLVPDGGPEGLVLESGQPMALGHGAGQGSGGGVAALVGIEPAALLCVPCGEGERELEGVLQLVDKADGTRFSFDDVEVVSLLARVAGSAIGERPDDEPPTPRTLAGKLEALAASNATRYAAMARTIDLLLEQG